MLATKTHCWEIYFILLYIPFYQRQFKHFINNRILLVVIIYTENVKWFKYNLTEPKITNFSLDI
jgi:hypothetical protein